MLFEELLQKLYTRRRFGIKPGVERVLLLLEKLGNPHHAFNSIHVVGTNGKGSTSAFLSSILTASGFRTAFFSSPHLVHFRERFRINDIDSSDQELYPLLLKVLESAPEEATFFEIVTALGALFFAEAGVQIAVMEAGMGGISDATSVMGGGLTLVTPISLDHCDYLGNNVSKIAAEKIGIASLGSTILIGRQPEEVRVVAEQFSKNKNRNVLYLDDLIKSDWNADGTFNYSGISINLNRLTTGINGLYQIENASLALAAAEILRNQMQFAVTEGSMLSGIEKARWGGRMEIIEGAPRLLLDGAHNPAGTLALASALQKITYRRLILIFGVMGDKDLIDMIKPLIPLVDFCYAVTPNIERANRSEQLASTLSEAGVTCISAGSAVNGLKLAHEQAFEDDLILICGSLFLVGEVKALLEGEKYEGIRG